MIYVLWNNGHASLALTGLNKKNIYISVFAPVNLSGQIDFSNGQGLRLHKLEWDLANHLFPYEKIAAIPTIESCGFGLSETAIHEWWKKIDGEKFAFSMSKNNCRTVVADAILEGIKHSITLSQTAKNKLLNCLNNSKLTATIDWKEFIEIINRDLQISNTHKRIFSALTMIDKSIDTFFIEGCLADHLISISFKLMELKELSVQVPEVMQLVFEIESTITDMLSHYLTFLKCDYSANSFEDVVQAITDSKANEKAFKFDRKYNELNSRCKTYLNLRYTFWSDKDQSFKNDTLIQTIKNEINSDDNPQKKYFRNRSSSIAFVK